MQIIDDQGPAPFDASAFVTYNNEEDVTPTEAELVEDLPEHDYPGGAERSAPPAEKPLRRGKGYLRAEATTADGDDSEKPEASPETEFGAGIDDNDGGRKPTDLTTAATVQEPKQTVSGDARHVGSRGSQNENPAQELSQQPNRSDTPSAKGGPSGSPGSSAEVTERGSRRRRRSRQRGKKGRRQGNGPDAASQTTAPESTDNQSKPEARADGTALESSPSGKTTDGAGEKQSGGTSKRRRRNRRRRRGGSGGEADGGGGPGDAAKSE
ncbi:MAG: hypothetical protein RIK87_19445 [Fuerstiella sp.]